MGRADVLVVGSYVQDLTWRCGRFPRAGETVVGEFATGPGGKGSNQAVAAGRAGARTCFIGAVGRDVFGQDAKRFYRREGIEAVWAEKRGLPTGTAGILVGASGENQIVVSLGANGALVRKDIDLAKVRQAKVVVCQLESNLETTAYVLRTARRAGVATVLNPAPMRADFDVGMLADVDVLIPNETEFLALVGRVPRAAKLADDRFRSSSGCLAEAVLTPMGAELLHRLCREVGPKTVIVTLGRRGCLVSRPEGYSAIAAHKVRVVDTTGAGDAFVGGFAAGYVRSGRDVEAAARYANAVAALSVTRFGTARAMPKSKAAARLARGGSGKG